MPHGTGGAYRQRMEIPDLLRQIKHTAFVVRRRGNDQRIRDRYRRRGVSIADDSVWIHETARLDPGVRIAHGVFINRDVHLEAGTTIGARVFIGPGSFLCTRSHEIGPRSQRAGAPIHAPIVVQDGVWIGAHVVILPGVTIARGTVVAAGAVVTKDTAPDGVYGGVPARLIRVLDQDLHVPGAAL